MAYRYYETGKFRDARYRGLGDSGKVMWEYLVCECDSGGFGVMDWGHCEFMTGKGEVEVKGILEEMRKVGLVEVAEIGERYWVWVVDFVEIQVRSAVLRAGTPGHKPIIVRMKGMEGIFRVWERYGDKGKTKDRMDGYKLKDGEVYYDGGMKIGVMQDKVDSVMYEVESYRKWNNTFGTIDWDSWKAMMKCGGYRIGIKEVVEEIVGMRGDITGVRAWGLLMERVKDGIKNK